MAGSLIRNFDKAIFKKCIKCRNFKRRVDLVDLTDGSVLEKRGFGANETSSDGLQSICFACKNVANTKSRERNVTARIRHHTGTRCLTQIGKDLAPKGFVANLEDYLGYKIVTLVRHLGIDLKEREGKTRKLRDALNEGYHIDHKKPLSSFKVIQKSQSQEDVVDWDAFRRCWAIENLRAIPAEENLAKGSSITNTE